MSNEHQKLENARALLEDLFSDARPSGVFANRKTEFSPEEFHRFIEKYEVVDYTLRFLRRIDQEISAYLSTKGNRAAGSQPQKKMDSPSLHHPGMIPVNTPPLPPVLQKVTFTAERNASVGKEYKTQVQASREVEIIEIKVPDGIGLKYDPATRELGGIPTAAGEHTLRVSYRHKGLSVASDRPALEGQCTLVVNHDPRSLWLNKDSDRDDPDWKPDMDKTLVSAMNGLRIVAASKRGRSHAHVGSFRDDDFAVDSIDGWNILAVADGAGSAKRSRKGSKLAVDAAIRTIKDKLGPLGEELEDAAATLKDNPSAGNSPAYQILGAAAHEAMKAIEQEAKAKGSAIREYATTLILAVHRHTGFGELVATFWVGDGAVGLYSKENQRLRILGEPDSGDFAGQTRFLDAALVSDSKEIMQRIKVVLSPQFSALVLMTDGVSDPKFETDHNLGTISYWDSLWEEISPLLAGENPDDKLLDWLDFWSPGNHDDRTIAMLWK